MSKLKKNRRPKDKYVLEIHFDTKAGVENFHAALVDGGADQQGGYYSEKWGKDWVHLIPPSECCPKCEFDGHEVVSADDKAVHYKCHNCGFKSEEGL